MAVRRLRSRSTNSPHSPALLTRGFASLRRRRPSNSMPTSPLQVPAIPLEDHAAGSAPQQTPPSSNTIAGPSATSEDQNPAEHPHIRLVPNVGLSSRCFVFDIVDRVLHPGVIVKIGRYSERSLTPDRLSFKSKVVSRVHAELWVDDGKIYIKDVGSSSGTFVNRIRLSPPNMISAPHELKDGDLVQLGVDYQGGAEPMYRAVRMRFEVNRESPSLLNPFSRTAFQQLRRHLLGATALPPQTAPSDSPVGTATGKPLPASTRDAQHDEGEEELPLTAKMALSPETAMRMRSQDIQECCICLYAIAPFQALFIAPCSHIFHFKCLRPIVYQNYPGFSCPLCRGYFDLEATVNVEVSELLEALAIQDDESKDSLSEKEEEGAAISTAAKSPPTAESSEPEASTPAMPPADDFSIPAQPSVQEAVTHLNTPGEHLLSTTLVGSPTFEEVVVTTNDPS